MLLPYDVEVFFASMAQYNQRWFPAALLGLLLALVALVLAARPLPGREIASARLVGALLAATWVWVGAVYQLQHMATLNFMAPVYGVAWIAQGVLIGLTCTVLGRVRFRFGGDVRGRAGLALSLFALLGYPLLLLGLGSGWQALPLVGTASEPTAVFTAGVLLTARERPPLHLFVLPLAWAGVVGVSAYLLDFALDYAVSAAILVALALALRPRQLGKNHVPRP